MKKREKKRKKTRISPLRKIIGIIGIIAGILLIASTSYFNVKNYEITGNSYYSKEEIMVMGDCKSGQNIFWGTDLKDIKTLYQ